MSWINTNMKLIDHQESYRTRHLEQSVQKYLRLNLKQIGTKQNLQRLHTSTARTFPPQWGHDPGACRRPTSVSSSYKHILPPPTACAWFSWFGWVGRCSELTFVFLFWYFYVFKRGVLINWKSRLSRTFGARLMLVRESSS